MISYPLNRIPVGALQLLVVLVLSCNIMNLYLISQTENDDWGAFDSAVVVAESAEQAKITYPDPHVRSHGWTSPDNVKVQLLGVSNSNERKVVCSSFNAG